MTTVLFIIIVVIVAVAVTIYDTEQETENHMVPILMHVWGMNENQARITWKKWGANAPHVDFPSA